MLMNVPKVYVLVTCSHSVETPKDHQRVKVIITSAEGGYVVSSACLSVCLSVRQITEKVVNVF